MYEPKKHSHRKVSSFIPLSRFETGSLHNIGEKQENVTIDSKKMQPIHDPSMTMHGNGTGTAPMIQRQEDEQFTVSPEPDMMITSPITLGPRTSLPSICSLNPEFPDFYCLLVNFKRNIDENLYNNAHHFTRIANLYPDDSQLMEDTFFRYGLGVNLLETSFGFLGFSEGWATGLAYGTGIGLKALDFFNNGELILDFQLELFDNVNLDLSFDLYTNPEDYLEVRDAQTVIGVSGHF